MARQRKREHSVVDRSHNMARKGKIALILEANFSRYILRQFTFLVDVFEIKVFTFDHLIATGTVPSAFELELYRPDPSMPGFMRGLEKRLVGFDIIMAIGPLQLVSRQALRISQNLGIPLVLFDNPPLLEKRSHDAVCDFFKQASLVVLAHAECRQSYPEALQYDAKMMVLSGGAFHCQDIAKAAHEKFRSYFEFALTDRVLTIFGSANKETQGYLAELASEACEDLKILVVDHKDYCQDLKYFIHSLGLARQTSFIHQEPQDFLFDIFAASDEIIFQSKWILGHKESYAYYRRDILALGFQREKQDGFEFFTKKSPGATLAAKSSNSELKAALLALSMAFDPNRIDEKALEERLLSLDYATRQRELDLELGKTLSKKAQSFVYCLKGEHYALEQRYSEAVLMLEQAVSLFGTPRAYLKLGYISLQSHAYDEALTFFRKVLTIEDKHPKALLGLGLVNKKVGLIGEAIYYLDLSIRLGANETYALTALAQSVAELKDPRLALTILEDLIGLVGEHQTLMHALGSTLIKSGDTSRGYQILDKLG